MARHACPISGPAGTGPRHGRTTARRSPPAEPRLRVEPADGSAPFETAAMQRAGDELDDRVRPEIRRVRPFDPNGIKVGVDRWFTRSNARWIVKRVRVPDWDLRWRSR